MEKKENLELKKTINEISKINKKEINNSKLLIDSLILIKNEDINLINSWIAPNKNISYELIYIASRDGDTEEEFHGKCDNKAPTLVLGITPKGYIFGGYTKVYWNHHKDEYLSDSKAFVFSINQKKNLLIMIIVVPFKFKKDIVLFLGMVEILFKL